MSAETVWSDLLKDRLNHRRANVEGRGRQVRNGQQVKSRKAIEMEEQIGRNEAGTGVKAKKARRHAMETLH